jgi:transcriptional regulator GlxA family with amidase domain
MSARRSDPIHVSLIATPDAQVSPLAGLFETLQAFELLAAFEPDVPRRPFAVEIVAPDGETVMSASGLPLGAHRPVAEVEATDIAIVPLMMVDGAEWRSGRYPGLVRWLQAMHERGAMLCSACTGVLLLAETGLLSGREATLHWAFAPTFRRNFPDVRLRPEEVLVTAGDRQEFVMSGGVTSWHDLALHLIARHVGPTAAQGLARLLMLQWHSEGQAPFRGFVPDRDHGDGVVLRLQDWLGARYMIANPVEEMCHLADVPARTLERRFAKATGLSPISYVQALRVEEAKRRLERTARPVDEIAAQVGYENAAFFRRLFKRETRMTPGAYRRRFQPRGLSGEP